MDGAQLKDGIVGAHIVICNDYEFELIRQKTGMQEADVLAVASMLIITRGEHGSTVITRDTRIDVPAVPPDRIVDPTGVGDAFRGGLMKGLASGRSLEVSAKMGSVAATWALEHLGGTSHAYTWAEFVQRYEAHFGAMG
jgi:adenosine kinase